MKAKTNNYAVMAEEHRIWQVWETRLSKHQADELASTSAGNVHVVTVATAKRVAGQPVAEESFPAYRKGSQLANYTVGQPA